MSLEDYESEYQRLLKEHERIVTEIKSLEKDEKMVKKVLADNIVTSARLQKDKQKDAAELSKTGG